MSTPLPSSTAWKTKISAQKLEAIFAGAAEHSQYPDPTKNEKIEELQDKEFKNYRKIALTNGYSLENPSTFFIQHVYPAVVGKLPEVALKTRLVEQVLQSFLPERSLEEWPQRAVTQIISYLEEVRPLSTYTN